MAETIKKEDIKKAIIEGLEPFTKSIKKDFDRMDERFDGVDQRLQNISTTVANLEMDMKEIKPDVMETKEIMNKLFNRIDKFLYFRRVPLTHLGQGYF